MLRAAAALTACAALLMPAVAQAGGWATVSLEPRPEGARAGEAWVVDLTVLQHGRTPLPGVEPSVSVTGPDGRERRFAARPTGRDGVYRARVVWPGPGKYTYEVDDGFGNAFPVEHPPVRVAAAGATAAAHTPPAPPGFPWTLYLVSVGALAAIGAALALALRDRAPQPRKLPRTPVAGPATAPEPRSRATSSAV